MACCFEVQQDVADICIKEFGEDTVKKTATGYLADMQTAVIEQLMQAGIRRSNIACANMCTYCRKDLFYSHRRDHGNTGAMGSFFTIS